MLKIINRKFFKSLIKFNLYTNIQIDQPKDYQKLMKNKNEVELDMILREKKVKSYHPKI
jgi:hypothetical protein